MLLLMLLRAVLPGLAPAVLGLELGVGVLLVVPLLVSWPRVLVLCATT